MTTFLFFLFKIFTPNKLTLEFFFHIHSYKKKKKVQFLINKIVLSGERQFKLT